MSSATTLRHADSMLAVAVCAAGIISCSSAVPADQHRDAVNGSRDASSEPALDTKPHIEATVDSGLSCEQTVEAYCATHKGCIQDYPGTIAPFCAMFFSPTQSSGCGPYHEVGDWGVDVTTQYVYSTETGKLVAIVWHRYTGGPTTDHATCLAGPPGFVEPRCEKFTNVDCSADGGPG